MEFDPKERQKYLGGSEIGAVLGINPWKSKHDVYIEKTCDNPTSIPENEKMYWGTQLESSIIKRWNKERKFKSLAVLSATHPTLPFIKGHPDAMFEDAKGNKHIIECKTTDKDNIKNWSDGVPSYYYYQLVYYAMILNRHLNWAKVQPVNMKYWIILLAGGNDYREFEVSITEDDMVYVEETASDFWLSHVTPKIMPEYTEPTKAINEHLYPTHDGSTIEADKFMNGLVKEYRNLKQTTKKLCDEADRLKEVIKNKIGHNSNMVFEGKKIASVSSYNRTRIDWQSVANNFKEYEDYPELVKNNTKDYNTTTLR